MTDDASKFFDRWTGREIDRTTESLPSSNGMFCETCGTECVDRCLICGAPQCCPRCCWETTAALENQP